MPGNGGWNTSYGGTGTNGAVQATDPPGYEPIDRTRNNLILLSSIRYDYQLDRAQRSTVYFPAPADTYIDHPDWIDVPVDWDRLKGDEGDTWTVQALIELKCEDAGVTVTARIVEAGTSTPAGSATSAHASTSWGSPQTITITSSTGVKSYRLQFKRSATTAGVRCLGILRKYKT